MRYGSVQNAEIHLFCSENRNFLKKHENNTTITCTLIWQLAFFRCKIKKHVNIDSKFLTQEKLKFLLYPDVCIENTLYS